MEPLVIMKLGAEGGGAVVFGRQSGDNWTFWLEGSTMDLDDNDVDYWRSWTSAPVTELLLALPPDWFAMRPFEVDLRFVTELRREYERCLSGESSTARPVPRLHDRWHAMFAEVGPDT